MKIKLINALLFGLTVSLSAPTLAQEWPTKPVKLLVGASPGGGTDQMARAVADKLTPMWGQTVVVENRPGASNTLAADVTAKATDGQTMLMGVSTAQAIAPHLLKLNYDNAKDLIPVAFTGSVPNVLVVAADSPVNSVQDLVKLLIKLIHAMSINYNHHRYHHYHHHHDIITNIISIIPIIILYYTLTFDNE